MDAVIETVEQQQETIVRPWGTYNEKYRATDIMPVAFSRHTFGKQTHHLGDGWEPRVEATYDEVGKILCENGHSIARPLDGPNRNAQHVDTLSYVFLDFDGMTYEQFQWVKNHPLVRQRGLWQYSDSHDPEKPHGIKGHWFCKIEGGWDIHNLEQAANAANLLQVIARKFDQEFVAAWKSDMIPDKKVIDTTTVDIARLAFGSPKKQYEIWGTEPIRVEELDEFWDIRYTYLHTVQLDPDEPAKPDTTRTMTQSDCYNWTEQYILPNLINGRFEDKIGPLDSGSYNNYIAYWLGWSRKIGIEAAGEVMDLLMPDKVSGYSKLSSFEGRRGNSKITFYSTLKILTLYGWVDPKSVIGSWPIKGAISVNERYLSNSWVGMGTKGYAIKSPKGTGKTESLLQQVEGDFSTLIIGHRVTLVEHIGDRLGIEHYNTKGLDVSRARRMSITVDSLLKLDLRRQYFQTIIIDESEQVLQHLTGATVAPNRVAILEVFKKLLKDAKTVVFLDADMSFLSINFLKLICGDDITIIENEYKVGGKTIAMYPTPAHVVRDAIESLARGEKVAFGTNSLKMSQQIKETVLQKVPDCRIQVVSSETSFLESTRKFVRNINESIKEIDLLLYTPSLGTGISIDPPEPYFDKVCIIGVTGSGTHFDLDQQMNRVRHPKCNCYSVYAMPGTNINNWHDSRREDLIKEQFNKARYNALPGTAEIAKAIGHVDEWYVPLFVDVQILVNTSQATLRRSFVALMESQGNTVIQMGANEEFEENLVEMITLLNDSSEKAKQAAREAVQSALRITQVEAARIQRNTFRTEAENNQLKRYSIERELGIPTLEERRQRVLAMGGTWDEKEQREAQLDAKAIQDAEEGKGQKAVMLSLVSGELQADIEDRKESDEIKLMDGTKQAKTLIPDRKYLGARVELLQKGFELAGLGRIDMKNRETFGDNVWFTYQDLKEFDAWIDKTEVQEQFRDLWSVNFGGNREALPVRILSFMLDTIGLQLQSRRPKGTYKDDEGKRAQIRSYAVSPVSRQDILEIVRDLKERRLYEYGDLPGIELEIGTAAEPETVIVDGSERIKLHTGQLEPGIEANEQQTGEAAPTQFGASYNRVSKRVGAEQGANVANGASNESEVTSRASIESDEPERSEIEPDQRQE